MANAACKKPTNKKPATKKKPAVKAKKAAEKLHENLHFEIIHNGSNRDYVLAASKSDADEIEKRLSVLVRSKKIRGYHRHAEMKNNLYARVTPDQISKS